MSDAVVMQSEEIPGNAEISEASIIGKSIEETATTEENDLISEEHVLDETVVVDSKLISDEISVYENIQIETDNRPQMFPVYICKPLRVRVKGQNGDIEPEMLKDELKEALIKIETDLIEIQQIPENRLKRNRKQKLDRKPAQQSDGILRVNDQIVRLSDFLEKQPKPRRKSTSSEETKGKNNQDSDSSADVPTTIKNNTKKQRASKEADKVVVRRSTRFK